MRDQSGCALSLQKKTGNYKHQRGKPRLLGPELLVATDVVQTVALEAARANVSILGLFVRIRTL